MRAIERHHFQFRARSGLIREQSCRFFHLIKGPFSHERRSHASLFLSAVSCHAASCRVAPGPRHADVVPPPIYHPLGALSFPPILAAPFAERWKCIDRRMARAGKRTGFPSQPPFPSHLPSLSLSALPPRRLLPHLVLHASLPSSSSSVYLPLLWNTFRVFPLSLCSFLSLPTFSILYDAAFIPRFQSGRRGTPSSLSRRSSPFMLTTTLVQLPVHPSFPLPHVVGQGKIFMPMYRFAESSSSPPIGISAASITVNRVPWQYKCFMPMIFALESFPN